MEYSATFSSLGLFATLVMLGSILFFVSLVTLFIACRSRHRSKDEDLNPLRGIGTTKYSEIDDQSSSIFGQPPSLLANKSTSSVTGLSPAKMIKVSSCYATLTSDSSSSDEEERFGVKGASSKCKTSSTNQELRIGPKGYIKTMPVQPAANLNSALKNFPPPNNPQSNVIQESSKICQPPSSGIESSPNRKKSRFGWLGRKGNSGNENQSRSSRNGSTSSSKSGGSGDWDSYPMLTISLSLASNDTPVEPEHRRDSIVIDLSDSSTTSETLPPRSRKSSQVVKLQLIRCEGLKRSIEDKENAFSRVVKSRSHKSNHFHAEGVMARIYRLNDTKEPQQSVSGQSSSGESGFSSLKGGEIYLKESKFVTSRKSKTLKFTDSDHVYLGPEDFPIRISVYEVDKNLVRSPLGHVVLHHQPMVSTNGGQTQIVLRLHPTVSDAIYDDENDDEKYATDSHPPRRSINK
ncbi:uncharacterized protein LOC141858373 isoform X2 [Brevipalpus obovatus]|uniref:uncharacterized protein LOC141858373 isoform X2 n=1 Tax=Brevipalpus obovatus TaxID=246614 RepID=UPI003D9DC38F